MKFSLNWIKKYVDVKKTPEEIAEILSLKTAEVESVKKLDKDFILEIKVLYNRGDLLSHFGIARELSAITGKSLKNNFLPPQEFKALKISDFLSVDILNAKACPRYTARVVDNITVGPSPDWLKESLESVGLRSINNIVDITNYVMLELGQPLHAFDYNQIINHEILVRNAKPGEKVKLLDESSKEYELPQNTLIVADLEKVLAVAGIKGGKSGEVLPTTTRVILESANFSGETIRRTSLELGLKTDASTRFSYGLDPNMTQVAIDRAALLIQEVCPEARVYSGVVDNYPKKIKPTKIALRKNYVNSLLGTDLGESVISKILNRLYISTEDAKDKIIATVPTFRQDVVSQEDLVEEVARIYGYENIKSEPPISTAFNHKEIEEFLEVSENFRAKDLIRDVLRSMGFLENYNYSFLSKDSVDSFLINSAPEIANPVSQNARYMRTDLLPNLIISAQKNLRFIESQMVFEIGRIFKEKGGQFSESQQLAGLIVSKKSGGEINESFAVCKGVVESLLEQLGIDDYEVAPGSGETAGFFHDNILAIVKYGDTTLGSFGQLSPKILSNIKFDSSGSVYGFVFNLEELFKVMRQEVEFEAIPRYPSIIRDVSILVNGNVSIEKIMSIIEEANQSGLIRDVDVFDIYENDSQDQNSGSIKSVAFHLVFRSNERTLKDSEAENIEKEVVKNLEQKLGAKIK